MNAGFVRKAVTLAAFGFALNVALIGTFISAAAQPPQSRPKIVTNDPATYRFAYQHGYRAGYEDGFTKGKSDFNESQPREFSNSDAYNRADRGYEARMGTKAEFEESYRTGFELGYNDGFYGRPFTVSIPSNLRSVVIAAVNANNPPEPPPAPVNQGPPPRSRDNDRDADRDRNADRDRDADRDRNADRDNRDNGPGPDDKFSKRPIVPDGVEMKIRLNSEISTKTNREGDKFTAVVLDPSDYAEAVVEGHIGALNKSGKATGKTEMSLAFDTIRLRDGSGSRFAGQVVRVYQSETVKTVDEEGNVETGSRTKDTATRGVAGGALGAIIGGIAGGGKGAAIGAILGAGVGAGSVLVQDGKSLILEPGTEILIRTAAPARTRD
jgi:outer membrane lipoprotein SlyB